MPRARRTRDDDTFDPIAEELADVIARWPNPFEGMGPSERRVAERRLDRRVAKWQRRIDKASAAWHAMTVLERKAWADEYLRADRKRRGPETKAPKAADLPLLYAIATVGERDRVKAAKKRPPADPPEAAAPNLPAPRPTRPSPAPESPATDAEPPKPEKPRRRRRGPAFGPVGQQIDGVFYPYITDGDDE